MKENAVISHLFYPFVVLSVRSLLSMVKYRLFTAKKGKTVMPSRTLQTKGEMCTFQMGKLCHIAININYILVLLYVQNCKTAQPLVSHGPSKRSLQSLHAAEATLSHASWHRTNQQSYESYIILRDRIVVCLVKSLNQGPWVHIWIHHSTLSIKG